MSNVFISHSSRDKRFAEQLADDLRAVGHEPWFDAWNIQSGDHIVSELQGGLAVADYVVIVLTPAALASGWVEREWQAAYWAEIAQRNVVVLPALLRKCELPVFLREKLYADFTTRYSLGLAKILSAIAHHEATDELRHARLTGIFNSYDGDRVPWEKYFAQSRRVRLMFAYARSWREKNDRFLRDFVARRGTRLEVILPDPADQTVMAALAHHIEHDGSDVKEKIGKAISFYSELGRRRKGSVTIYVMPRTPSLAMYMFDNQVVATLNSNLPGRREVPTLTAERGGDLYKYFEEEFRVLVSAVAKLAVTSQSNANAAGAMPSHGGGGRLRHLDGLTIS